MKYRNDWSLNKCYIFIFHIRWFESLPLLKNNVNERDFRGDTDGDSDTDDMSSWCCRRGDCAMRLGETFLKWWMQNPIWNLRSNFKLTTTFRCSVQLDPNQGSNTIFLTFIRGLFCPCPSTWNALPPARLKCIDWLIDSHNLCRWQRQSTFWHILLLTAIDPMNI